ncbi:TonB-dependent receptor [Flectobacillus sp. BAB-3569]|uniref:SusC/RagA family TonB-linked outer membrane protein n=1 Tax=Flectobacillus sp. BAB-3569 TaxID=1509483 RepID=UPI000BA2C33B|nr:TonB-dependent receptor [Flectobacillus sp. BAB-3569]PAC28888.1 SusC/RagA family TonB-linked outer membrane protein [Flectobacillus sp. BAB-3569]
MTFHLQPQFGKVKGTKLTCTLLLAAQFIAGAPFLEAAQASNPALGSAVKTSKADHTVTGSVKDSEGAPLAGVTIRIKNSKIGTTTKADGTFTLNAPTGKETLIISSIGYKTQEVTLADRKIVNVILDSESSSLDEVVVVGYGQQKKIHLTGAVAQIDMKAIEDLPVGSLSAALVAQQPGVGVSGGFARPGDPATITIRNPSMFSKDGGTLSPLVVIDNVIRSFDDFNTMDQSEVENISILKDAAAAIYGARGANGVIVVTTKRGKTGAPRFSYSTSVGVSDAKLPKMMNGYELATYRNSYNTGTTNTSLLYSQDELDYFKTNSQSWLEQAWKSSYTTRHALNVSGGTEKATYFASVAYNQQNGNFDKINFDRWSFRASADVKVSKNVKASLGLSGDVSTKDRYLLKQGGTSNEKDFQSLLYAAPFTPAYYNGLPVSLLSSGANTNENFHFFEAQKSNNYLMSRDNGLNINASLEYDAPFLKGLKARVTYNRNMENSFGKEFGTRYKLYTFTMLGANKHIVGGDVRSIATVSNSNRIYYAPSYGDSYQLNGYLTYDKTFGKHTISVLGLFEQGEAYSDGITSYLDNLVDNALDNAGYALGGTASGAGVGTISESESESGRLSFVGRVNYNYANKYLAEVSVRRDASTNFAPENRWGTFPSLSLGWVISEEPFFKDNVHWVDQLKFRASVGLTGMDNTRAYNWLQSYNLIQTGNGPVFGGNLDRAGIFRLKNAMPNRDLQWDDATKLNGGIDASFLKNRMSLTLDGFYDYRYNMLTTLTSSVPLTVGAALPSQNFGTVAAFGTEISLGWTDRINKDWSYKVRGFFSWSDNKQIKVDYDQGLKGTYRDPNGRSTDMGFLGLKSMGILRTQADLDALLEKNPAYTIYGQKPQVGMVYYQDVRGAKSATPDANGNYSYAEADGKIDDNDLQYLTNKKDNHFGFGLNFATTYKKLSFSFNLGGSFGGQDIMESGARSWGTSAQVNAITNLPVHLVDHWTVDNPNAKYPAPAFRAQNGYDSDFWFVSSFTLAVRTLNVSYELPQTLAQKLNINSARVYLTATNPLNLYNPYSYKYWGSTFDVYPTLSTFSLGLNLNL